MLLQSISFAALLIFVLAAFVSSATASCSCYSFCFKLAIFSFSVIWLKWQFWPLYSVIFKLQTDVRMITLKLTNAIGIVSNWTAMPTLEIHQHSGSGANFDVVADDSNSFDGAVRFGEDIFCFFLLMLCCKKRAKIHGKILNRLCEKNCFKSFREWQIFFCLNLCFRRRCYCVL